MADMELEYLQERGATATNRNDAWKEFLEIEGFPYTTYPDARNAWLQSLGYTGDTQDMLNQYWEECPSPFARDWTIGNMGDDYGYHVPNAYGGLVPNDWFNFVDTVDVLIVDVSANAAILQSNVSGMWGLSNTVTLEVEGFGSIILTWNGATSYINVGDTAFVNYVVSQLGNSIGVNILPKNNASPGAKHEITTLFDSMITTLNDNIIHTGT